MDVYRGNKVKFIKLGVKHPYVRYLEDRKFGYASVQTGALKIENAKVTACPVQYRFSKIGEEEGRLFPLVSVIGVSEFDEHILIGLRSKLVRFPNLMGAAPTGHMEFGLTPDDAMKMELKEELGVDGKTRLIGAQLSKMYLGLIYQIKLKSKDLVPSWEWSNLFWIQKDKLGEFMKKNASAFGPGFGASFVLYLDSIGEDTSGINKASGWNFRIEAFKDLRWKLNRIQNTF